SISPLRLAPPARLACPLRFERSHSAQPAFFRSRRSSFPVGWLSCRKGFCRWNAYSRRWGIPSSCDHILIETKYQLYRVEWFWQGEIEDHDLLAGRSVTRPGQKIGLLSRLFALQLLDGGFEFRHAIFQRGDARFVTLRRGE